MVLPPGDSMLKVACPNHVILIPFRLNFIRASFSLQIKGRSFYDGGKQDRVYCEKYWRE
jgi:hypothetical protein